MKNHLNKLCMIFCITASVIASAQKNLPDPEGLHGTHPSDCSRATPESVIDPEVFPDSKFLLNKDSLNGYNWLSFKNGDKLLIINCGCSDYTLVFQFTTSRYSADTSNYKYWYPKAVELMNEVVRGLGKNEPLRIQKGIDTLTGFIAHCPDSLTRGHILFYDYDKNPGDDITSDPDRYAAYMNMFPHLYLNRISKLNDKEYMVEIYFTIQLTEE
jgi:hypothetical protein